MFNNNRFADRNNRQAPQTEGQLKTNEQIKAFKVLVIDNQGQNLGVLNVRDAITKAKDASLDLVEVSPESNPPVCRIMDFRKYLFEQKKKLKDNQHKSPKTHEIQLTPTINQHDLEVKAKKALEFLGEGSKVILSFKVKGREAHKTELIQDVVKRFYIIVEAVSTMESKAGSFTLIPK